MPATDLPLDASTCTPPLPAAAAQVLEFWFAPSGPEGARPEWFRKDAAFDALIGQRFGALMAQALDGGLRDWDLAGPAGGLARILLLDQFTRNVQRATPGAFAGDALALAAARALVENGADLALPPWRRAFVYMPFEHAEDMALQDQALALFQRLSDDAPGFEGMLDFAKRHRAVIARFGRFPHRNAILGRASTAQEIAFLAQAGSGF